MGLFLFVHAIAMIKLHPPLRPLSAASAVAALLVLFVPGAASTAEEGPPVAVTPDGGRYWGPLVDGRRQGQGRVEWSNGASYSGGFVDGLFQGKGRTRDAAGNVMDGEFVQGLAHGHGSMTSAAGTRYTGEFRNGLLDGTGHLEDAAGNVYDGEFKANLYHGNGQLKAQGYTYTGEFRLGQLWGQGKLLQSSGRSYQGDFARGLFDGKGVFTIPNGPRYEGQFRAGELEGHAVVTYPDGTRQEGDFHNWQLHGEGVMTDANGARFEGRFENGQPSGRVKMVNADGDRYEGEIRDWLPHGKGELHLANGNVYRGGFEHGLYSGQGTLTYAKARPNGHTQDNGEWEYGRLKAHSEEERRRRTTNAEKALYTQTEQLRRELQGLQDSPRDGPRRPGDPRIGLYLLNVAGDGSQEVFHREVDFVRKQFAERFGTTGRSVTLVNSRNTVGSAPLATVTSIRQSVMAIAARMDKERDILFLYLTSHGGKDATLSLQLEGMRLPDLTAAELAAILKDSGIRWKVVVISACYSGSFIPALKDPGTLLITAARADRTSFGCADDNDFTYFGRAFFKEALPSSDSFEQAFTRAETLIRQWEERDDKKRRASAAGQPAQADQQDDNPRSLPQIDAPDGIRRQLLAWRRQQQGAAKVAER